MLDPTILREYDIRGIVGDTLKTEDVFGHRPRLRDGSSSAREGARSPSATTGVSARRRSRRLSSRVWRRRVSPSDRIGLGPSPMLYFAAHHLDADGGDDDHRLPQPSGVQWHQDGEGQSPLLR